MSFDTNNRVKIGEYNVLIPDKPSKDSDFINYNKSIAKQKFHRLEIPPDLKSCSEKTQEDFVKRMFHKRRNGEWLLIKDTPIYLTGQNWYFLNFWFCAIGRFPDFRIADTDFWQWWKFEICADKGCYGGLLIKSRREGATEKNLCEIYEYGTRVRNTHGGMQNMTDTDVAKDYHRIVRAHNKMIWFFKPVNTGSDKPADGLIFELPSKRMTESKINAEFNLDEEIPNDFEPLYSKITFEPTKLEKYDGQLLNRYRQGEFGKIPLTTMDMLKRWEIVKPCLHLFNGQKIIGKALFESTVEELGDGSMLENTIELWNDANPNKLVNGRTANGLKRLFRSALDTAEPDEWGFPKKEETKKFLEAEFARLEKEKNWTKLSDLQRKNPITIEHALTPSAKTSLFNAEKLKKRLQQLQNDLWWNNEPVDHLGNPVKDVRRRGNFVWANGQRDTRVIFVDHPEGKWFVSQLLSKDESNRFTYELNFKVPANRHLYGFGVDPIDTKAPEGNRMSSPASALFRKLDMMVDASLFDKKYLDAEGHTTRAGDMQTHQFVATYCYRPDEAREFYEDMIMQAVYYGVEVLYERNKGAAMRDYFKERGYWGYLSFRPDSTKTAQTRDNEPGLPASEGSAEAYTQALMDYTSRWIDNCKHPELISDTNGLGWLTFRNTPQSRTKHDLTVASGFALLAAGTRPVEKQEEMSNESWFEAFDVMNAR